MSVEKVLEERRKTHGNFKNHSDICQKLKRVMYHENGWHDLSADKKEALDMIQHKIARILNGNPEVKDHWTDIIGYATLVEKTLSAPPFIVEKLTEEQYEAFRKEWLKASNKKIGLVERKVDIKDLIYEAFDFFMKNGYMSHEEAVAGFYKAYVEKTFSRPINEGLPTEVKL